MYICLVLQIYLSVFEFGPEVGVVWLAVTVSPEIRDQEIELLGSHDFIQKIIIQ